MYSGNGPVALNVNTWVIRILGYAAIQARARPPLRKGFYLHRIILLMKRLCTGRINQLKPIPDPFPSLDKPSE